MGAKPKIKVTLIDKKGNGKCHYSHKIGDTFDFDTQRGALYRYGGRIPRQENDDSYIFFVLMLVLSTYLELKKWISRLKRKMIVIKPALKEM